MQAQLCPDFSKCSTFDTLTIGSGRLWERTPAHCPQLLENLFGDCNEVGRMAPVSVISSVAAGAAALVVSVLIAFILEDHGPARVYSVKELARYVAHNPKELTKLLS